MKGVWSGDQDLGTKELQALYKEYCERCTFMKKYEVTNELTVDNIKKIKEQLKNDFPFLNEGVALTKEKYEKTLDATRKSEVVLMELSWDLTGYEELVKQASSFLEKVKAYIAEKKKLEFPGIDSYLQGLYSKKRSRATHLLVFMIAGEMRNKKPYAVPVRFLNYHSITDAKLRELEVEVETAMKRLGMVVVGKYNI